MTGHRIVVVVLCLSMVAAACGGDAGGGEEQVLAAADLPRLEGDASTLPEIVESTNEFATDLYGELAVGEGNLVFSPQSVAIALAMTRAGAGGLTADEFDQVLHLAGLSNPHAGFNVVDQELEARRGTFTRGDGTEADLELRIANALWGQQDAEFEAEFLELLAEQYGAGMRLVDYVTDAEAARIEINEWVAEQTSDKIEELVPQGALNSLTRLVLTNAVYLLAPWEWPFSPAATEPGPFVRIDGSETTAELMRLSATLPYASGDGWQAVELPYAGRELAMTVVVPDAGTFAEFEAGLDGDAVTAVTEALAARHVSLHFPRFEFRTQASLKPPLQALGLVEGFDPAGADFSAMSTQEQLFISDVVHEAFIAVDEEGTEAAAATAVVITATSAPLDPVRLVVDRPFLFLIRDRGTGAILFFGRVLDPTVL